MSQTLYAFITVLVIAVVTAFLRFLPFLIFNSSRPVPKYIQYLGSVLPYSIMAMLVVYCLKDLSFASCPDWAPALLSVAGVVLLHVWKRNTLLSIVGGTVCYMLLLQFVF